MIDLADRHFSTQEVARRFSYDHLPPYLAEISKYSHDLAERMIVALPDGPELTVGLRRLLDAKNSFVMVGTDVVAAAAAAGFTCGDKSATAGAGCCEQAAPVKVGP